MSEYDDVEDRRKHEDEPPPEASVHVAKWSPWIWIVPVLAIFFVGFLIVRYGFFGGGDITVRFAEARGLDRYSPVRFRDRAGFRTGDTDRRLAARAPPSRRSRTMRCGDAADTR